MTEKQQAQEDDGMIDEGNQSLLLNAKLCVFVDVFIWYGIIIDTLIPEDWYVLYSFMALFHMLLYVICVQLLIQLLSCKSEYLVFYIMFRQYPGPCRRWATTSPGQGVDWLWPPWHYWAYWRSIKFSRHFSGTYFFLLIIMKKMFSWCFFLALNYDLTAIYNSSFLFILCQMQFLLNSFLLAGSNWRYKGFLSCSSSAVEFAILQTLLVFCLIGSSEIMDKLVMEGVLSKTGKDTYTINKDKVDFSLYWPKPFLLF